MSNRAEDQYISTAAVAHIRRCAINSVRLAIRRGILPAIKVFGPKGEIVVQAVLRRDAMAWEGVGKKGHPLELRPRAPIRTRPTTRSIRRSKRRR